MIKIVARSIVKEENREAFMVEALKLVEETRKEEGCISYALHEDINNPTVFCCLESWTNQEAINGHNESEHVKTIVPRLRKLRESVEINLYREL